MTTPLRCNVIPAVIDIRCHATETARGKMPTVFEHISCASAMRIAPCFHPTLSKVKRYPGHSLSGAFLAYKATFTQTVSSFRVADTAFAHADCAELAHLNDCYSAELAHLNDC